MLGTRLLVSALLIPAFVGLCWLDARTGRAAAVLMPLALLLAIQACRETAALLKLDRRAAAAATLGSLLVIATVWAAHALPRASTGDAAPFGTAALGPAYLAFAGVVLGLLLLRAIAYEKPAGHAAILAAQVFTVAYVGVLLSNVAALRWAGGGRFGYLALGSLVIGAKVGDVGGYTFGRLFGKRKLAPALSPGKTVAGGVGAVLTAAVATACWLRFAYPFLDSAARVAPWWELLLFGATLGVVGLVGDLCESLLKRDAGMKDASALMPAFGGLLDLIDSVLYAAPVAVFVWIARPPVW